jgi:solute carrier family 38 (sodium-coupled neutral amino acid transporter), member 11
MVIIVISVIVEGAQVPPETRGSPDARFSIIGPGIFQAIGVISFAFVCHHNSLLIYGSLNTPTLDRFAAVTHVSTFLSLVSCCTLAISAFLVFTDKTQGNILNNFPQNDTLINVARFCFGMNMFTTLPLELFVCREVSFIHRTVGMSIKLGFRFLSNTSLPTNHGTKLDILLSRPSYCSEPCSVSFSLSEMQI